MSTPESSTAITESGGKVPATLMDRRLPAGPGTNIGAVAIETERAVAEIKGQLFLAKQFPRDLHRAREEFLESCASLAFAQKAFYSVPNRGAGPSIRFAEEAARCYGNFDYGHRELSRGDGKSEIEVFAWDKEKNNYSKRQITVEHIRDTKNGPQPLRDQADIDNRIANVASKQMRGRILALLPKALIAEGEQVAKNTLASGGTEKTIAQRVSGMTTFFAKHGVTVTILETYLGHKLDITTADELTDLVGIANAIKEGAKPSDYFNASQTAAQEERGAAIMGVAAANQDKPAEAEKPAAAKPAEKAPAKATAKSAEKTAAKSATPAPQPEPEPQPEPVAEVEEEEMF